MSVAKGIIERCSAPEPRLKDGTTRRSRGTLLALGLAGSLREGGPDIASSQTRRRLGSIRDWECRRESNMRYWLFMHSEWEPQTTWGVAVEVPSNLLKEDMQGSGRLLFMYMNFVTSTIMVLPFYLACH